MSGKDVSFPTLMLVLTSFCNSCYYCKYHGHEGITVIAKNHHFTSLKLTSKITNLNVHQLKFKVVLVHG